MAAAQRPAAASARDQHDAGSARRTGRAAGRWRPRRRRTAAASDSPRRREQHRREARNASTGRSSRSTRPSNSRSPRRRSPSIRTRPRAPARKSSCSRTRLHEPVQPNTYVTVIGEVVHADAGEIAKKARPGTPPLPADVLAKYQGKPVILATAVINGAFTDLAKFIPPPMTPEEAVLDKAMKVGRPGQRRAAQGRRRRRTPNWSRPTPRSSPRRSPRPRPSGRAAATPKP